MTALARAIGALSGWRRWLAAAAFGGLAVLALPPVFAAPVLFISFTGLLWLIDGTERANRPWRAALAVGWWFGFAYFVGGLYWITHSLFVDAKAHGWMAPFAVSGLSLYFAVYPALACLAASRAPRGWPRVLILAVAWAAGEWLRGIVLTGFPWNPISSALAFDAMALQGLSLVGAYGMSLLVVAVAAVPATLVDNAGQRGAKLPAIFALAIVAGLGAWGVFRVAAAPGPGVADGGAVVRIVQGNIDQRIKWRPDMRRSNFLTHMRLSRTSPGGPPPDIVIWPETAVPYIYRGDAQWVEGVGRGAPPGGALITGAVRSSPPGVVPKRLWNTVIALNDTGIAGVYDKHHLVPFGEYVPARGWLPITKITAGRLDFSAGPGPRSLTVPGLPPFAPLVCYEAIFPGAVVPPGPRPKWLLNLTNDAWFGNSTGPHQHLAAARMRAVEEGLPLIRAANTGISAVIDPWGRVLERLALGRQGVIQRPLSPAIERLTPFARFGNGTFALFTLFVILISVAPGVSASRRNQ